MLENEIEATNVKSLRWQPIHLFFLFSFYFRICAGMKMRKKKHLSKFNV